MITLHATCITLFDHGVLLRGPSGSGKSDLALRLIDQGAMLVGDDYCHYHAQDGGLYAAPIETIAGLLEVRGIGIVRLPYHPKARVRLVVDLVPPTSQDPAQRIERLPPWQETEIAGVSLPFIRLYPFEDSAAAKVRLAVRLATGIIESAS